MFAPSHPAEFSTPCLDGVVIECQSVVDMVMNGYTGNPFNPVTDIPYSLAAPGELSLGVYDAAGRMVRHLADGVQTAGGHIATWDGRDDRGVTVTSGLYFCRLRTGKVTETRRMVLLK